MKNYNYWGAMRTYSFKNVGDVIVKSKITQFKSPTIRLVGEIDENENNNQHFSSIKKYMHEIIIIIFTDT